MSFEIIKPKPTPGNVLLEAALAYQARGLSIVPTIGKKAATPWTPFQKHPPDEPTLRRLFKKSGIDGLAVVLGAVSGGLCCRDYDRLESYERWAESHRQLADALPTAQTHRGRHVYFRGTPGFIKFEDGEYRGTPSQYTILPPSRHPSGSIYRWLVPFPEGEPPLIDPAWAGLCNRENRENTTSPLLVLAPLSLLQTIEQAIRTTLPTAEGQRNRCLFNLARHLRSVQALEGAAFGTLRPIVEQWHLRACPAIATKPFLDTWVDFVRAWKSVRVPAGAGVIQVAFQRASASTTPTKATELYGKGSIVLLTALCRELQAIVGDGQFFIDCRTAGRLIGVDHATAWRYLNVLCADGILIAGAKGSLAARKASRFRFVNQEQGGADQ